MWNISSVFVCVYIVYKYIYIRFAVRYFQFLKLTHLIFFLSHWPLNAFYFSSLLLNGVCTPLFPWFLIDFVCLGFCLYFFLCDILNVDAFILMIHWTVRMHFKATELKEPRKFSDLKLYFNENSISFSVFVW